MLQPVLEPITVLGMILRRQPRRPLACWLAGTAASLGCGVSIASAASAAAAAASAAAAAAAAAAVAAVAVAVRPYTPPSFSSTACRFHPLNH